MKSFFAAMLPLLIATGSGFAQDSSGPVTSGVLTEESLGQTLNAIGLKPVKTDKRYDFAFKTSVRGEEWKFSMSAVLSRNGQTVWIMAWLDEIPKQSSQVPQLALLKLLAANDRMGNGKFFAYIPTNKRFVLQRVISNKGITPKSLTAAMQDLAVSVADEYPNWSVAKWAPNSSGPVRSAQRQPIQTNGNRTQTSEAATKFSDRSIR